MKTEGQLGFYNFFILDALVERTCIGIFLQIVVGAIPWSIIEVLDGRHSFTAPSLEFQIGPRMSSKKEYEDVCLHMM